MQQAMKDNQKEIFENFYIGVYDTPKKLNRSTKKIPMTVIQLIEGGDTSIEMIEKLSKDFPVFIYKSCITIHGIFDTKTTGVGGYKNLRLNQNGSLEILYSAIDNQKIKGINE